MTRKQTHSHSPHTCHVLTPPNRRFNAKRIRYECWNAITLKLSEFEGLINDYRHASPDEVHALKQLHTKLYECWETAKHFEEELRPYERILR